VQGAAEGLLIGTKAGIGLRALAQISPVSARAGRMFEGFPRTVFSGTFVVPAACIVAEELQRGQSQGLNLHGFPGVVWVKAMRSQGAFAPHSLVRLEAL
jgi:hypothetical protein